MRHPSRPRLLFCGLVLRQAQYGYDYIYLTKLVKYYLGTIYAATFDARTVDSL
jgi:hypothetical protein